MQRQHAQTRALERVNRQVTIHRRYATADESVARGTAKPEVLLDAQRGVFRLVAPLRTTKFRQSE